MGLDDFLGSLKSVLFPVKSRGLAGLQPANNSGPAARGMANSTFNRLTDIGKSVVLRNADLMSGFSFSKSLAERNAQRPMQRPAPLPSTPPPPVVSTIPSANLLDQLRAIYAPELAAYDAQAANLLNRANTVWANIGAQRQAIMDEYRARRAQNALGGDMSNIDRDAILRQLALIDKLRLNQWNQGVQTVQNLERLDREIDQARELEGQSLDLQKRRALQKAERDSWAAREEASARGASTSHGLFKSLADIETDKVQNLEDVRIADEQSLLKQQSAKADNENTRKLLRLDLEAYGLNADEQKAKLNDRLKQLDVEARARGINANLLAAQMNQALHNLNLQGVLTVGQLLDQASAARQNKAQVQQQIAQQWISAGAPGAKQSNSQQGFWKNIANLVKKQPKPGQLPPGSTPGNHPMGPYLPQPGVDYTDVGKFGWNALVPNLWGNITYAQIAQAGKLDEVIPGTWGITPRMVLEKHGLLQPQRVNVGSTPTRVLGGSSLARQVK